MELRIDNKIIDTNLELILKTLRDEISGSRLKHIKSKGDNVLITCPYHKNGQENHPSCQVYSRIDNKKVEFGTVHCFSCGKTTSLIELVAECFGETEDFAKEWLVQRFGNTFIHYEDYLEPIVLGNKNTTQYLSEDILQKYNFYHPYMYERKLTKEVIDKFKVGYDAERNAITFPVWDEHNNLVMVTARCVDSKMFYLDEEVDKPIYLYNYIKEENITTVYVTESQINALTLWSWGYPAIALFGTGSTKQYEILKKSGIRSYILCFDGDEAGDKGRDRFIRHMKKDVFISTKQIPRKKDVNNLTKLEFDQLNVV